MNSITTQSIQVIIFQPVQYIIGEKLADAIAPCAVKIDGIAPGGTLVVGKIWPEPGKVIPFRPQVIIYHVQQNGNAFLVTGVHQFFQSFGAAIRILHRVRKNAIIAPVSASRELRYRH